MSISSAHEKEMREDIFLHSGVKPPPMLLTPAASTTSLPANPSSSAGSVPSSTGVLGGGVGGLGNTCGASATTMEAGAGAGSGGSGGGGGTAAHHLSLLPGMRREWHFTLHFVHASARMQLFCPPHWEPTFIEPERIKALHTLDRDVKHCPMTPALRFLDYSVPPVSSGLGGGVGSNHPVFLGAGTITRGEIGEEFGILNGGGGGAGGGGGGGVGLGGTTSGGGGRGGGVGYSDMQRDLSLYNAKVVELLYSHIPHTMSLSGYCARSVQHILRDPHIIAIDGEKRLRRLRIGKKLSSCPYRLGGYRSFHFYYYVQQKTELITHDVGYCVGTIVGQRGYLLTVRGSDQESLDAYVRHLLMPYMCSPQTIKLNVQVEYQDHPHGTAMVPSPVAVGGGGINGMGMAGGAGVGRGYPFSSPSTSSTNYGSYSGREGKNYVASGIGGFFSSLPSSPPHSHTSMATGPSIVGASGASTASYMPDHRPHEDYGEIRYEDRDAAVSFSLALRPLRFRPDFSPTKTVGVGSIACMTLELNVYEKLIDDESMAEIAGMPKYKINQVLLCLEVEDVARMNYPGVMTTGEYAELKNCRILDGLADARVIGTSTSLLIGSRIGCSHIITFQYEPFNGLAKAMYVSTLVGNFGVTAYYLTKLGGGYFETHLYIFKEILRRLEYQPQHRDNLTFSRFDVVNVRLLETELYRCYSSAATNQRQAFQSHLHSLSESNDGQSDGAVVVAVPEEEGGYVEKPVAGATTPTTTAAAEGPSTWGSSRVGGPLTNNLLSPGGSGGSGGGDEVHSTATHTRRQSRTVSTTAIPRGTGEAIVFPTPDEERKQHTSSTTTTTTTSGGGWSPGRGKPIEDGGKEDKEHDDDNDEDGGMGHMGEGGESKKRDRRQSSSSSSSSNGPSGGGLFTGAMAAAWSGGGDGGKGGIPPQMLPTHGKEDGAELGLEDGEELSSHSHSLITVSSLLHLQTLLTDGEEEEEEEEEEEDIITGSAAALHPGDEMAMMFRGAAGRGSVLSGSSRTGEKDAKDMEPSPSAGEGDDPGDAEGKPQGTTTALAEDDDDDNPKRKENDARPLSSPRRFGDSSATPPRGSSGSMSTVGSSDSATAMLQVTATGTDVTIARAIAAMSNAVTSQLVKDTTKRIGADEEEKEEDQAAGRAAKQKCAEVAEEDAAGMERTAGDRGGAEVDGHHNVDPHLLPPSSEPPSQYLTPAKDKERADPSARTSALVSFSSSALPPSREGVRLDLASKPPSAPTAAYEAGEKAREEATEEGRKPSTCSRTPSSTPFSFPPAAKEKEKEAATSSRKQGPWEEEEEGGRRRGHGEASGGGTASDSSLPPPREEREEEGTLEKPSTAAPGGVPPSSSPAERMTAIPTGWKAPSLPPTNYSAGGLPRLGQAPIAVAAGSSSVFPRTDGGAGAVSSVEITKQLLTGPAVALVMNSLSTAKPSATSSPVPSAVSFSSSHVPTVRDIYLYCCAECQCKPNSHLLDRLPLTDGRSGVQMIEELDLSGNYVGHQGFTAVLRFLEHLPHVTQVYFNNMSLDNVDVENLCGVLSSHPTMRGVHLRNNPSITLVSTKYLHSLLRLNRNIQALSLQGTRIGDAVIAKLEAKAAANKKSM